MKEKIKKYWWKVLLAAWLISIAIYMPKLIVACIIIWIIFEFGRTYERRRDWKYDAYRGEWRKDGKYMGRE